jgi:hypothetical protein
MFKNIINAAAILSCAACAAAAVYMIPVVMQNADTPSGLSAFMLCMMFGAASLASYAAIRE